MHPILARDQQLIRSGLERFGIDADRTAVQLAEDIVGHPLPGSLIRGGSLTEARAARAN